jgi:hypothetical protein
VMKNDNQEPEKHKVFHVILDEKFIDNAITVFDSIPDTENEYLLVSRSEKVRMIKQAERVTLFASQLSRLKYIRKKKSDVIILHSLFFGATLVPFFSGKTPLVWISWGHDLYKDTKDPFTSSFPFRHALFLERTRQWLKTGKHSFSGFLKSRLKAASRNLFRTVAIRKISYVSTCLPYEFPVIQKKYPHLKSFLFDYIDDITASFSRCTGRNILIGNSASINCNHLDVLDLMKKRELNTDKIIVPLSYAGGKAYRDAVIREGSTAFGKHFYPLTTFMNIDEYTALIRSCGFAVMGFLRQQATKNIQLLMWQGTKVFFYRDTDIFRYFRNQGDAVFSVEDDLTTEGLGSLLGDSEVETNRKLISLQFDYNQNISSTAKSLGEIYARSIR